MNVVYCLMICAAVAQPAKKEKLTPVRYSANTVYLERINILNEFWLTR